MYAAQSERIVLWASPLQAATLLRLGQARMHTREKKVIRCIQLTGQLVNVRDLGCRPGSFGISEEETSFGRVYAHKRELYAH